MAEEDHLPLGFEIIMRSDIWPFGEGAVHNLEEQCSYAPESGVQTDLHTVPSDGKNLCSHCDWPGNAEEALNYDD